MNWYLKVLKKYAVFTGRARRKEYWMFVLVNCLIVLAGYALMAIVGLAGSRALVGLVITLLGIYGVVVFLPTIAVSVRRLHDIGKSGWWILILFVPLIGGIWLLILLATDSQFGDNQYGHYPKH